jgi:hypothetical protein
MLLTKDMKWKLRNLYQQVFNFLFKVLKLKTLP